MNGILDRIKEFAKDKKITISALEELLGMSNGYFNTMRNREKKDGKAASIGSQYLSTIIEKFPELNLVWLLAGKGEMFNSAEKTIDNKIQQDKDEITRLLKGQVEVQKAIIDVFNSKGKGHPPESSLLRIATALEALAATVQRIESKIDQKPISVGDKSTSREAIRQVNRDIASGTGRFHKKEK